MTNRLTNVEVDVRIENHGNIFIVQPMTQAAREWIDENVQSDAQWWSGGVCVDQHCIEVLIGGMLGDGLEVA